MAGPMTHMLVSQAACDPGFVPTMHPGLRSIVADWQPFLLLGSVGPDLPAIVDATTGQHVSDRLHDGDLPTRVPTNTTVRALYRRLKTTGTASCAPFAFLLGYASHAVSDVVVHPVVNQAVGGDMMQHRHCETCQDSLLYSDLKDRNLKHSDYLFWLKLCHDQRDNLDAVINAWEPIIHDHYGRHSCRLWMKSYETGFSIARQLIYLEGWGYPSPAEIHDADVKRFYSEVALPGGAGTGQFKTDVFPKAVASAAALWQRIYQRFIDRDDASDIADIVPDWNFNTGANLTIGRELDLWS